MRPVQHPKLYLLRLAAYIERHSSGLGASDRCLASSIMPSSGRGRLFHLFSLLFASCGLVPPPLACLFGLGLGLEKGLEIIIVIN